MGADDAATLAGDLAGSAMTVSSVERKPYTRKPDPPFRTSTLQQDASRKFRFGARRTMSAAQRLYENGHITYMRTDSTSLSEVALTTSRAQIAELFGDEYLSDGPRQYSNKVKNAQEAHEAIRPAGDVWKTPEELAAELKDDDQAKVYELIWKRTLASQMAEARGESVQVRVVGDTASGRPTEFAASGRIVHFPGFLKVYVVSTDDPESDQENEELRLPAVSESDPLDIVNLEAKGHETKAPARYTEASLVRRLEELGVGRPSTYASIISTIQDRGYVWKKGTALVPTFMAFATISLLEGHFANLVDYAFTARMEDELDKIARGEEERVPWLSRFFHGNGSPGLKDMVSVDRLDEIDAREINSIRIGADENGELIVARAGKYGPYVARGDDTASIPDDLAPDELTVDKAIELLNQPSGDKILGTDPDSGLTISARHGRYGPYVQLGEVEEGSKVKPKTASLLSTMTIDELGIDQALELLALPRTVGAHPESGEEIQSQTGRYGPYIKMGKETRSLETEEQIFTITLDEAVALLAQPKRRRGQTVQPPLRELGKDPVSDGDVVVKDGRFGLYVTDGVVNASFRKAHTVDTITLEEAAELLQARRDRLADQGKWPPKKK
jgi:DNA topoisomerase-1